MFALVAEIIDADPWHVEAPQVKVAKVPAEHAGVAMLGVKPAAQAALQVAPWATWGTPMPQSAVAAAPLVTVEIADTRHALGVQVAVGKTPPVAGQFTFPPDVYPVAQATLQVPPATIDVTPAPQCPVPAPLGQLVGTAHACAVAWQAKVAEKVPRLQVTLVWLAV